MRKCPLGLSTNKLILHTYCVTPTATNYHCAFVELYFVVGKSSFPLITLCYLYFSVLLCSFMENSLQPNQKFSTSLHYILERSRFLQTTWRHTVKWHCSSCILGGLSSRSKIHIPGITHNWQYLLECSLKINNTVQ